jgi:poly(A) polymerase
MKIKGDWLDHPGTQSLCSVLAAEGFQALLVGGCVRNALLHEPVSDTDIATDAMPQIVAKIAETAGFKTVPTGIDHGTITVIALGKPHEVTTFRRDVETDGRRAVVAYSDQIEEDAQRRDFTMNALYADRHGTVIDPLNGLPDLLARRVRFVGEAETRIREDYLRILRFFRFHASYGDPGQGIDPEGLAACAALSAGLATISKERITSELRKLLAALDPAPAVAAMAQAGVLGLILPAADFRALAPLVHLEINQEPRWERRLAVLGGTDLKKFLRLSRAEERRLETLRQSAESRDSLAALGALHGLRLGQDVALVRAAMLGSPLAEGWESQVERGSLTPFPVTAFDLMPDLQDEALGARLKKLHERWLASDLTLTRDDLLKGA